MNRLDRLRQGIRWLSPLLGLVLLLGVLAPVFHHHPEESYHRSCAVCSVEHAPAIVIDAAPRTGQPWGSNDCAPVPPDRVVPDSAPVAASPRAPPLD